MSSDEDYVEIDIIQGDQGWTDATLHKMAYQFLLDDDDQRKEFIKFLQETAEMENDFPDEEVEEDDEE